MTELYVKFNFSPALKAARLQVHKKYKREYSLEFVKPSYYKINLCILRLSFIFKFKAAVLLSQFFKD